jgi:hypothetical protein
MKREYPLLRRKRQTSLRVARLLLLVVPTQRSVGDRIDHKECTMVLPTCALLGHR